MKFFLIAFLMFCSTIKGQTLKNELFSFNVDYTNNEYVVKIGKIDDNKSQVELEIKCYNTVTDYKKQNHTIEILDVKQKINGSNLFFGGELVQGEYVIILTYLENGKKIKKIEKKVVKNLTN